jgi:hypothetical protein
MHCLRLSVGEGEKQDKAMEIAQLLILSDANRLQRDDEGWNVYDEAVALQNKKFISLLISMGFYKRIEEWEHGKGRAIRNKLEQAPDFYLEVHLEFASSVIPFFSKLSPSDTFKIWKFGSYIRFDFTLVGFSKLKAKR